MKYLILVFSFFTFTLLSSQLLAQQNCKVLLPGIDSIYKGKCKNGLAHGKGNAIGADSYEGKFANGLPNGKGIYIWANGDKYEGSWLAGKRDGEGILTLKLEYNKDSILNGLWENDQYMGPKPVAPEVFAKVGIDRFTFKDSGGIKERVLIDIFQNGMRNTTVSNFRMSTSNGVETKLGNSVGYDYVEFPVTIRVSYTTRNKLKTLEYQAIFEFKISEPGDWRVEIHN